MISKKQNPEEQELERKSQELTELETELAELELEYRTLDIELRLFELRYLTVVGVRYAELDEIEAQIAAALAKSHPNDNVAQEYASFAQKRAEESTQKTRNIGDYEIAKDSGFRPTDSLKKLYREVAKSIHPDLAVDENECTKRQNLMARANEAYEHGDEPKLKEILDEWNSSPESIVGEGVGADLIRIIRKIAQTKNRFVVLRHKIDQIKGSDMYNLKLRVEAAENGGNDLLKQMAQELDRQIVAARNRLDDISKK